MVSLPSRQASHERAYRPLPGALVLFVLLAYVVAVVVGAFQLDEPSVPYVIFAALSLLAVILILCGFFVVQPNSSKVIILLGKYKGTVRREGFHWAHPIASRHAISLKANNVASNVIKVNDLAANPIEIGAVVVWEVRDTAQAKFDVEDYRNYVDVQIETAVRQLASSHPYDDNEIADDTTPSLRGDSDLVNDKLRNQLQQRLDRAGIAVVEARLSHLAYAPEIAAAMLQRQQATAIIAARQKIVEGAVSMVEDALAQLSAKQIVELDAERKASLVGNLLIVLCGHENAQPIINAGTMYN
jgi:regulator of protease activity HflC (stomatin/prohibitin superfamily)